MEQRINTIVIGGSQAGLATGYYLKRFGIDFIILDENDEVGAAWRNRWDTLRLFTPGSYNDLPGMPFPGGKGLFPHKDEIADYLVAYADRFELPIKTGIKVDKITKRGNLYLLDTSEGLKITDNVVVATGAFHHPRIPTFADSLHSNVLQLHSSNYHRPTQLKDGAVLIVGAGSSGAEIALELAKNHQVWLSGRDPGQEPPLPTSIIWFLATKVFNVANPIGRKLRKHFLYPPRGIPRGRVTRKDLKSAGVNWVTKTSGVYDGKPQLEDGQVLEVNNVIWCTGYKQDYRWIDLPIFDSYGYPIHERGMIKSFPGMYFMGLQFQQRITSSLIGGVGKDAKYIAKHIEQRQSEKHPSVSSTHSQYSIITESH